MNDVGNCIFFHRKRKKKQIREKKHVVSDFHSVFFSPIAFNVGENNSNLKSNTGYKIIMYYFIIIAVHIKFRAEAIQLF